MPRKRSNPEPEAAPEVVSQEEQGQLQVQPTAPKSPVRQPKTVEERNGFSIQTF